LAAVNKENIMLALSIDNVKIFMVKLLKSPVFDEFTAKNVVVDTFARFEINASDEAANWENVRSYVFDIIKNGGLPRSVKVVICADGEKYAMPDVGTLFINIHFEGGKINLTTGLSKKNFSLDKTDERQWDEIVIKFLENAEIKYTNLV